LQQFPLLQSEICIPNSENEYQIKTSYQYDSYGNITHKTIEVPNFINKPVESRNVEFQYSSEYNHRFLTKTITEIVDVSLEETLSYYPKTGLLNNQVDINGLTTQYNYDSFGRMKEIISPNGNKSVNVLRWSQDHIDNPLNGLFYLWKQTSGLREVLTFFDNNGRTLRSMGYGLDESSKIFADFEYYNSSNIAHGNLKIQSESYYSGETALNTLYTYLPNGQLKTIDSPTNDISYTYDGLDFIIENITTGQTYTRSLNAISKLVSATDAGGIISYSYNSAGKPTQVINGEGPDQSVISITYNNAGFQTELQDPDAGNYTYVYNPLGELISSTDENGNNYEMNYDVMGRIIEKKLLNPLQVTTYTYDGENALGILSSVTGWDGISTHVMYDQYSMVSQKTEIIQGVSYDFNYEYDIWGNLKKETWPTGYEVNYKYKNGFLSKVIESSSSKTLWQLNNINARGQIREYLLGNGLTTVKNFDIYGFPTSIVTSNNIQNLEYNFNTSTGNLTWRKDLNDPANSGDDLIENFGYDQDQLNNRLTSWSVLGGQSFTINYNNNGNINEKSDVGNSYVYNVVGSSGGPHAVSSIVQPTEAYLNIATPQEIEYTAFNKVSQILNPEDNLKLKIGYGPNNQRKIYSLFNIDDSKTDILIKKKYFVNNDYEIEVNEQGAERKLHYLYAADGLFAIYIMENNTGNMYYIHKDYLGSYQSITDKSGAKIEELSFDPWGRRRNPNDWSFNNVPDDYLFDCGFTGHEHLDEFNLINMNGRMYDPFVARFLSPDPVVQSPDNTQSINRYSYVLNNPFKFIDPTGHYPKPFEGGYILQNHGLSQGFNGPGSGNHWSDQFRDGNGNFMLMSSSTYIQTFGQESYDFYANQQTSDNYDVTDKDQINAIADGINRGLCFYLVDAFNRTTLVASDGPIGETLISEEGAIYFSNTTDAAFLFNSPQGQGVNFDNSDIALDIGGGIYGGLRTAVTPGDQWLGKNGKYYNNSWGGNRYTGSRSGAFAASNTYKWAGRGVVGAEAIIGGVLVYNGYLMDGGQFGYNANLAGASATGGIIGGWAGAEAGATVGAAIGVWFGGVGAVPGAIIGGFVGGIAGSLTGNKVGEMSVNYYYGR